MEPDEPSLAEVFEGPEWDAPLAPALPTDGPAPPPPHRRRRRVSLRRLHRRRRTGLAMLIIGGAILVCGLWVLITGLLARGQLNTVRIEVRQLRSEISAGDVAAARHTAAEIASHAHRAHLLTSGPLWAITAAVPYGGEPFGTVRQLTAQVDAVGHDALPALVSASRGMDPATLRRADGSFDLALLGNAAPALDTATGSVTEAAAEIAQAHPHTWLSSVDSARTDLLGQLMSLRDTLASADVAAHVVPSMLGANGPRRYFMAIQNDAEARGTGGLPGAFAIVQADHGRLKFLRFEPDSTLLVEPVHPDLGADYAQLYQNALTTTRYSNSNLTANFPYAARIWQAMWQKHSGQRLDGALAIDPQALSYLLAVTGPATLPNGSKITSANIVQLTESEVYAKYPNPQDQNARKQYLLQIARVASEKVLTSQASTSSLLRAAGQAVAERRLLAWSADPTVEAQLAKTAIAGAIPNTAAPYVGLSIVNDGGNKLDYYLDRSLRWDRTGCGSVRDVTVTITLTNNAPASGLSYYVTARSDPHSYPVRPGDNRLEVGYYATRGAELRSVTVAGKPGTAAVGAERGHPVYVVDLELPRGQSRTIVLHLHEPQGTGSPIVLRQPLVRPLHVSLDDVSCG